MKRINLILSIIVALIAISGAIYAFDCRYAKDARLTQIEARLNLKILKDRAHALQERMWALERHYGSINNMPPAVRQEYLALRAEYNEIMALIRRHKG